MPELFKKGGHIQACQKWVPEFGKVFGIYNFRAPILYVTDPEAIKNILVKDFEAFTDRYDFLNLFHRVDWLLFSLKRAILYVFFILL